MLCRKQNIKKLYECEQTVTTRNSALRWSELSIIRLISSFLCLWFECEQSSIVVMPCSVQPYAGYFLVTKSILLTMHFAMYHPFSTLIRNLYAVHLTMMRNLCWTRNNSSISNYMLQHRKFSTIKLLLLIGLHLRNKRAIFLIIEHQLVVSILISQRCSQLNISSTITCCYSQLRSKQNQ